MSQSSNAQREPSMEEILSSIRKIIEDGDPSQSEELPGSAAKAELRTETTPPAVEPSVARSAAVENNVPEIEEFRRELTAESPAMSAAKPIESTIAQQEENQSPTPALDIEKELSEEMAAPELPDEKPVFQAADVSLEPAAPSHMAVPVEPDPQPEPTVKEESAEMDQDVFPVETTQRLSAEPNLAAADGENIEAAAADPAPEQATLEQPDVEQEPKVPEIHPARPIISEIAGRKIAASFEQLSEAFAETRKKSFDEMAEEMLRPMLQEWLDNNLPLLVERLVREEIERVARAGAA